MSTEQVFTNMCADAYRDILNKALEERRALVISTTSCPACTRAKNLLDRNEVGFKEIFLDRLHENDHEEVTKCVYGDSAARYVPIIYMDKKRLGGY